MDLRRHIRLIPGQQLDGATGNVRRPRRALSMVAVVVAALLLGAAIGKALPTKPEAVAAAQATPSVPEPVTSFVYFPSQYVNQATETDEHIQAF